MVNEPADVSEDLIPLTTGQRVDFNRPGEVYFHVGQTEAWNAEERFVAVIAGTQSGKTSFGPYWLEREIKRCGPGDYMVITPTYPLLDIKALPELRRLFEEEMQYGKYYASPRRHVLISDAGEIRLFGAPQEQRTVIYFGYAEKPESLESATLKAVWLDEAGQRRFKLASFRAILRRLSLAQGRALITTTPYDLGWLHERIYLPWLKGDKSIKVVNFSSIENPAFPIEEWERAERDLPKWAFDLFYRGKFSRPAGLIYDSFSRQEHVIPRFPIPERWRRYVGLDFGGINTAAVFFAEEPGSGQWILYRTYKSGKRTTREHSVKLLTGEERRPDLAVGGSFSEDQWRREFGAAGYPIQRPDMNDVEVGIQRVYSAHANAQILVFDDLEEYLTEKGSYSRVTDVNGAVLPAIEDKNSYHLLDAERYIIGKLNSGKRPMQSGSRDEIA